MAKTSTISAITSALGGVGVSSVSLENSSSGVNEFAKMLSQISEENPNGSKSMALHTEDSAATSSSKQKVETNSNSHSTRESTKAEESNTENKTTQSNVENKPTLNDKIKEAIDSDEISSEIKDAVVQELNVSEEELELAMEKLGFTYLDLTNASNLAKLMTELSGSIDVSLILTDENLFMEFTSLSETIGEIADELLKELGITKEEFNVMLDSVKQQALTSEIPEEMPETTLVENSDDASMKENLAPVIVSDDEESNLQTAKDNNETVYGKNDDSLVTIRTQNNASNHQSSLSNQFEGTQYLIKADEKAEEPNDDTSPQTSVQSFQERISNEMMKTDVAATSYTQETIDVKDILNQVNSHINLSLNGDETKMEFQLNPEYLGKVIVQLVSRAGVVTAQLAAQNEAVKEVLESQIVQLRENMNNQGVKIEAVEVTIESHEFEKNLDQQDKHQEAYEQEDKSGRKVLNYREISDLEGLSDDETLVAEMMLGSGNSINYMA